jgi:hypothetical protein
LNDDDDRQTTTIVRFFAQLERVVRLLRSSDGAQLLLDSWPGEVAEFLSIVVRTSLHGGICLPEEKKKIFFSS